MDGVIPVATRSLEIRTAYERDLFISYTHGSGAGEWVHNYYAPTLLDKPRGENAGCGEHRIPLCFAFAAFRVARGR